MIKSKYENVIILYLDWGTLSNPCNFLLPKPKGIFPF